MANEVKGPRPWTKGNRGRRGRIGRPPGSGRPPLGAGPSHNLNLRIPQEDHERLLQEAKIQGTTIAQVVRGAIADYFDDLDT